MEIEKQRGISVASSVMQMEYRDCVDQPARHAGPPGLLRGHLPRADRGRRGADGDRRGQRRGAADAAAAAGLPRAQHADHHLRQQDGPRGARAAGAARRDRARCSACDGARSPGRSAWASASRGVFDLRADRMRVFRPGEDRVGGDDESHRGLRQSRPIAARFGAAFEQARGRDRAARRRLRRRSTARRSSPGGRRRCSSARRSTTSACARCSTRWSTSRRRRAPQAGAAARGRSPTSRSSPAWCSRSRPTWTRRTATASPSCASARAASSAACG